MVFDVDQFDRSDIVRLRFWIIMYSVYVVDYKRYYCVHTCMYNIIPFGFIPTKKGPNNVIWVFLICQKRRFFALTADGGNLAPTFFTPLSTRRV